MARVSNEASTKLSADLGWIDTLVQGWNKIAKRSSSYITVEKASYGAELDARLDGNVTSQVKMASENLPLVTFDLRKVKLGDPKPNQAKRLEIQYKCGPDGALKSALGEPAATAVTFGCK
jgi:hypothetical protein